MPNNIDKRGTRLTIITVYEGYSYLYNTFILPLYGLTIIFIECFIRDRRNGYLFNSMRKVVPLPSSEHFTKMRPW